jgi:hypothetical protein
MARASHHRASHHRVEWEATHRVSRRWASHHRVEISHRWVSHHRMKTTRAVRVKLILIRKRINKTAIKIQEIHPERRSNEKKICPNTGI